MSRRMLADPKSETGQLTHGRVENGRTICADGNFPTTFNYLQASSTLTRVGTEPTSAVSLFGHSTPPVDSMADHNLPQAAHDVASANCGQSDAAVEPNPSLGRGPIAQARDVDPSCAQPCCPPDAAILTCDNLHLSRVITSASGNTGTERFAINCTNDLFSSDAVETLGEAAADLLRHSLAANTERAYESDLRHFRDWGGSLPATAATICAYIAAYAGVLSVATIQRRIATLSKAHEAAGLINPCRAEIAKATLRGLKRKHGTSQRQAKPLMRDDLFLVLDRLGSRLRDQRDRALLLLGFAGGFRRSELVALQCADIETARQGLILTIRRSKTDQEGAGRRIGIPNGRTRYCPVAAVEAWLAASAINTGPLFRPITRHGHVAPNHLTGDAVSVLLRERLEGAGIDPDGYSGHSLRAGFATSAATAGVSSLKIRAQTGHASDAMLARYIRDGDMFSNNAAGSLL